MAERALTLVSERFLEQATGAAFPLAGGQHVRVLTPNGPQVADFDVFNLHNPRETLCSSRTRAAWGAHLTTGHTLYSTPPAERVIMTIVADTVQQRPSARGARSHDVLFGRCSRAAARRFWRTRSPSSGWAPRMCTTRSTSS